MSLSTVVGGKTATALGKAFGIDTVDDLLRHYPRRYLDRGTLTELASLQEGETVTVVADIREVTTRRMKQRKGSIVEAIITDGTGELRLTFFNQHWRSGALRAGRRGLFSGQVGTYRGYRQLSHPQVKLFPDGVDDDPELVAQFAHALIPVYPATSSFDTWKVQQAVSLALPTLGDLPDPVPVDVRLARGLLTRAEAIRAIHQPQARDEVEAARTTLRFEEAFILQSVLVRRRAQTRALPATRRVPTTSALLDAFDAQLPFELTAGQLDVAADIAHDMAQDHPMHRLLQGDVGSGKTVVALRAMLRVVDAGGQAALLAPTEVLAAQHFRSISALLGPLAMRGQLGGADVATRVALLTGSQSTPVRRKQLLDIVSGDAGIIIGTHALIQDTVDFNDLALVVVDEQHRFGVEQRAALAAKSRDESRPHVLVMTATPIPRTVAMTVFGDVDVSTLSELPAGRAAISTHVVSMLDQPAHVSRVWQRVREEVDAGRRVFVVCPRIGDENEADDEGVQQDTSPLASVLATATRLSQGELQGLRVGVLHGRMSGEEKDDVMRRFSDLSTDDGIDVLVSTTVIEVGVDVPSATAMVILDADRFGISQLHQLRGRIGRGAHESFCILISDALTDEAQARLKILAETNDGFKIAEADLKLRGPGELLGQRQSGSMRLRFGNLAEDLNLIRQARVLAAKLIA